MMKSRRSKRSSLVHKWLVRSIVSKITREPQMSSDELCTLAADKLLISCFDLRESDLKATSAITLAADST
jgi:hypothetical protein